MNQEGGDVYLLDYSKESLRLVKLDAGSKSVQLILADAQQCPFSNNSFDIIFHQGLLEHFTSPFRLLKENYRLLNKNGLLIVDVPQTFHVYTILKQTLILLGLWFGGWERQFTIKSLSTLLKKMGFQPIHFYGDWSRPGMFYKVLRAILLKFRIRLPMFPKFFGGMTNKFYEFQKHLCRKKIFLYTVLSIGIIARKI